MAAQCPPPKNGCADVDGHHKARSLGQRPSARGQSVPLAMHAVLLLALAARTAADGLSWDGIFFDPDELQITITRSGSTILAHSADWEITGTLTSDTQVRRHDTPCRGSRL